MLVDGNGVERLQVSRVDPDVVDSGIDRTNDPAVVGARSDRIWYGPVTLYAGSEPHMTVAVAGARAGYGVTVAVINLKLIWDVISAIHVGQSGDAFVLDRAGRLVAHPDISLVLRGDDDPAAVRLKELQQATMPAAARRWTAATPRAARSSPRWRRFPGRIGWPLSKSRHPRPSRPIRAALWRTGLLLLAGAVFAAVLGLSAGAANDRTDPSAGRRGPSDRRGAFRPQDRDLDRRRARRSGAAVQRDGRWSWRCHRSARSASPG